MSSIDKLLKAIAVNPQDVRFSDLHRLWTHYFGKPRNKATSHHVYKTPWLGDPRVNIQKGKDGKAKTYQVKQVLAAINKLKEENNG